MPVASVVTVCTCREAAAGASRPGWPGAGTDIPALCSQEASGSPCWHAPCRSPAAGPLNMPPLLCTSCTPFCPASRKAALPIVSGAASGSMGAASCCMGIAATAGAPATWGAWGHAGATSACTHASADEACRPSCGGMAIGPGLPQPEPVSTGPLGQPAATADGAPTAGMGRVAPAGSGCVSAPASLPIINLLLSNAPSDGRGSLPILVLAPATTPSDVASPVAPMAEVMSLPAGTAAAVAASAPNEADSVPEGNAAPRSRGLLPALVLALLPTSTPALTATAVAGAGAPSLEPAACAAVACGVVAVPLLPLAAGSPGSSAAPGGSSQATS